MADIRKKTSSDQGLRSAWRDSIQPVIDMILNRLERLSLKGRKFKVREPVVSKEVVAKLKEMFPNIDPLTTTKANALSDQGLKNFIASHCRERQYCFQIRKCNDGDCCRPTESDLR